jgi:[acyl-carrier-protein] S-malonyltransferase
MQKACEETDGAMLCLIGGTLDDVNALCDEADVEISNANCPGQIVVSGERKNIRFAFEIAAKMRFRRVLPLNVAGAYHSRLMEGASVEFGKFLRNIEIRTPKMDVLTNISGDAVRSAEDIRDALSRQIVSPVLFEKCCLKAMEMGVGEFLECGPGRTLSGIIKKISGEISTRNFDKIKDFNG